MTSLESSALNIDLKPLSRRERIGVRWFLGGGALFFLGMAAVGAWSGRIDPLACLALAVALLGLPAQELLGNRSPAVRATGALLVALGLVSTATIGAFVLSGIIVGEYPELGAGHLAVVAPAGLVLLIASWRCRAFVEWLSLRLTALVLLGAVLAGLHAWLESRWRNAGVRERLGEAYLHANRWSREDRLDSHSVDVLLRPSADEDELLECVSRALSTGECVEECLGPQRSQASRSAATSMEAPGGSRPLAVLERAWLQAAGGNAAAGLADCASIQAMAAAWRPVMDPSVMGVKLDLVATTCFVGIMSIDPSSAEQARAVLATRLRRPTTALERLSVRAGLEMSRCEQIDRAPRARARGNGVPFLAPLGARSSCGETSLRWRRLAEILEQSGGSFHGAPLLAALDEPGVHVPSAMLELELRSEALARAAWLVAGDLSQKQGGSAASDLDRVAQSNPYDARSEIIFGEIDGVLHVSARAFGSQGRRRTGWYGEKAGLLPGADGSPSIGFRVRPCRGAGQPARAEWRDGD